MRVLKFKSLQRNYHMTQNYHVFLIPIVNLYYMAYNQFYYFFIYENFDYIYLDRNRRHVVMSNHKIIPSIKNLHA